MEYGKIERELEIDASPATVFEVITSPEHLVAWWPDEAEIEAVPGAVGQLVFGDPSSGEVSIPQIVVVDVDPPRLFSFRWNHPEGAIPQANNSLLVTFEITARGSGTLLRMTETGFRERGWEVALLEQHYRDHIEGWDYFLPRLVSYAATVGVAT